MSQHRHAELSVADTRHPGCRIHGNKTQLRSDPVAELSSLRHLCFGHWCYGQNLWGQKPAVQTLGIELKTAVLHGIFQSCLESSLGRFYLFSWMQVSRPFMENTALTYFSRDHTPVNVSVRQKCTLHYTSLLSWPPCFNSELFFSWALEMTDSELNGCWCVSRDHLRKEFESLDLCKEPSYDEQKVKDQWPIYGCFYYHFSRNSPHTQFSSDRW